MMRIEAPRLLLRDHLPEDLSPLHAALSDPAVVWYLPDMYRRDEGETQEYLSSCMRDVDIAPRTRYNLAVVTREGEYLGDVGLRHIDGPTNAAHYTLGYFLRFDRWNLGYATEAVHGALGFIFENGACRLSAACLAENLASRRVLEKCGFTQEALLMAHTWHDGHWKDCAVYRLLKNEYTGGSDHVP